jgi:hypothetical protein
MRYRLFLLSDETRVWLRSTRLKGGPQEPLTRAEVFSAAVHLFLNVPWKEQSAILSDYLRRRPRRTRSVASSVRPRAPRPSMETSQGRGAVCVAAAASDGSGTAAPLVNN